MSAKSIVRNCLVQRQESKYQKRLIENHVTYYGWITDLEKEQKEKRRQLEKEKGASRSLPIKVIPYTEIHSAISEDSIKQLPDEQLLVFVSAQGRLMDLARAQISDYFASHEEISLAYGDEDVENAVGMPVQAFFKPDWSPDAYRNAFYIGSIFIARVSLVRQMQKLEQEAFAPAQLSNRHGDADVLFGKLAVCAGGFAIREGLQFPIGHIREVLFRGTSSNDLFLKRPFRRTEHTLSQYVSVSIVIPSKDHPEILEQCVQSMSAYDTGDREKITYEIIVVDNGSGAANRLRASKALSDLPHTGGFVGARYIYEPMEFNFSRMCNMGAKAARGSLVLFLNDDITFREDGWLRELVWQALQPHVGAVGCKLLYPNGDQIQHAGITKVRLGPMHKLGKMHDNEEHYYGMNLGIHDMIGVTGACLMMRKKLFEDIGGFSETLAVSFNDVDLCYTLIERGYYNVCCNHVTLTHHESLSRGDDTVDPVKLKRLGREYEILTERHPGLRGCDPFYHPYLTDDEHVPDYLRVDDSNMVKRLPEAKFKVVQAGKGPLAGAKEDPVVRIGVEYSNTIALWIHNYQLEDQGSEDGYLVKGYSFVIGSDNALYERTLLLRKVEGEPGSTMPVDSEVLLTQPISCYREDIMRNLPDQVHVELTGFRIRIGSAGLPTGQYQIGMLYADQTSRTRLVGWAPNTLIIE